jgi:hypothetical protein
MPIETAIVIAGIVFFFAMFALSLAWADFRTRSYRAPESKHFWIPAPPCRRVMSSLPFRAEDIVS